MTRFSFTITVPSTRSATVEIEADDIASAQEMALDPSYFQDPEKVQFIEDEGNIPQGAYLPDAEDYSVLGTPTP